MRRTRHVVLPVKSWQYMGLMIVSLACLTLGLVSRDRGGRSGSLAGPELMHAAPHEVDACPNLHPYDRMSPYNELTYEKDYDNDSSYNRALVRVRNVRSSNPRISRSSPIKFLENTNSKFSNVVTSIRDRQSITNRQSIRIISTTRIRINNSGRQGSRSSQIPEIREKRSSLRREKPSHNSRSVTIHLWTHESNLHPEQVSDRSEGPRLLEHREKPTSTNRQRRTNIQNHRTSTDNKNTDETSVMSNAYSEIRRLKLQSCDHRSSERREDRVKRNPSNGRNSFEQRVNDSDTKKRSFLRRNNRLANNQNNDDQSSRLSQTWDHRVERRTNNKNSDEHLKQNLENQRKRSNLMTERSTDISRAEVRLGKTSQERASIKRHEMNQRENYDRLTDRSLKPNLEIRRSRSEDIDRVNIRRIGIISRESRSTEEQKRDSMKRRTIDRIMAMFAHRERLVNIAAKPLIVKRSSRDNIDCVDIKKEIYLKEHNSAERREINQPQCQKTRIDLTIRSRAIQQPLSPNDHLNVRRFKKRSLESRTVILSNVNQPENTENKIGYLKRVYYKQEEINRRRKGQMETVGSRIYRAIELRQLNKVDERQYQMVSLTKFEKSRTSGTRSIGHKAWMDSLRRNLRTSRFITFDISRDMSIIEEARQRQTFSMNRLDRSSRSALKIMNLERRKRFDTRSVYQEHQYLIERTIARELQTLDNKRKTSLMRGLIRTFVMNYLRHDTRNSGVLRSAGSERHERLTTRDISQDRYERSTERSIAQELGTSNEKHRASTIKREGRRTSEMDSSLRNIRSSRTSISMNTKIRKNPSTNYISQELRQRLAKHTIARELTRTVNERRVISAMNEPRQVSSGTYSLQRITQTSKISRIRYSENPDSFTVYDASQYHRKSFIEPAIPWEHKMYNVRRDISTIRELRQKSGMNTLQHSSRNSRTSRTTNSENHEHYVTDNTSQEHRENFIKRSIAREVRTSNKRHEASTMNRERKETSKINYFHRNIPSSKISRKTDDRRLAIDYILQKHTGRFDKQDIRTFRMQDGVSTHREKTMNNEIHASRIGNNREIVDVRSQMIFPNIPDFKAQNSDFLQQPLILVLCLVYGASLLRRKGGFYSFRKIITPANRLFVW